MKRSTVGAGVILGALVMLCGCDLQWGDDVLAPTQIVTQIQGGASPAPGASPGLSGAPPQKVKIEVVDSELCAAGTATDDPYSVRVGCVQMLECYGVLPGGSDAADPLGLTGPDVFRIYSGSGGATLEASEDPFRKRLRGESPGLVSVVCTIRGVSGVLDMLVVS